MASRSHVRHLPPRVLGLGVAALLLLTNVRELAGRVDLGLSRWLGYAVVVLVLTGAATRGRRAAQKLST